MLLLEELIENKFTYEPLKRFPKKWYHGTMASNYEGIIKNGFRPGSFFTSRAKEAKDFGNFILKIEIDSKSKIYILQDKEPNSAIEGKDYPKDAQAIYATFGFLVIFDPAIIKNVSIYKDYYI